MFTDTVSSEIYIVAGFFFKELRATVEVEISLRAILAFMNMEFWKLLQFGSLSFGFDNNFSIMCSDDFRNITND